MNYTENSVLPYIKNSLFYKEEYEDMYSHIDYQNTPNFFSTINNLLDLKYTPDEINNAFSFIHQRNIEKMQELDKLNVENYYTIQNFEVDKIHRYEEYQKKKNCSLEEAVLKVNIGLDHDFYTQIEDIINKDEYTVLVNKYHSLGEYEPSDLKSLSYDEKYKLREKAADSFEELVGFAKLNNVYIRPYSAYRSYTYQQSIYQNYVAKDGLEIADSYSARPGHSEHQTGLAVDVWSEGFKEITKEDAEWLKENSYKYGFIVRYTKETENITGYIEEPWHLRYVGIDIATDIYQKGITFDEYYDLYIK